MRTCDIQNFTSSWNATAHAHAVAEAHANIRARAHTLRLARAHAITLPGTLGLVEVLHDQAQFAMYSECSGFSLKQVSQTTSADDEHGVFAYSVSEHEEHGSHSTPS